MRDWVALNMTPGIGPRAAAKLLERFGSAAAVYGAPRAELEKLRLLPEAVDSIIARDMHDKAEAEIENVRKVNGEILILDDGVYPSLLREIYDPPITLYVKGAWAECLDQPCVAVVGSRKCSTYGQNAALMLSRDLARRGVTIVSGFARGIDAAAHRGAIEGGGRTIAVLGTGIDEIYPRDHKKLAEEILAGGGAMVTQFPLATPPVSENFPYRNRIISGLSLGVIVVEAAESSGSLITARLAIEQNREVFAVPGNITSRNSFGANYLIKGAGAKLVQQWQDIAAELPPQIAAKLLPPPLSQKKKEKSVAEQLAMVPPGLSGFEQSVFKLLSADNPAHIDALVNQSRLTIPDLTAALLALEMRDLVRALPGKCFVLKM
ncbi:MAG TPA: DNA-protecting protein DprA [Blastocatellia bacterium]|nr:DNA-protecting protein DprA [Blastocatellia bacterium]HAF24262.1 DNA-protecting protein DprA [Blastocatellia bacterium]HCX29689.1 DNA-protecting protein DprA [Blastocatellia bacterium]